MWARFSRWGFPTWTGGTLSLIDTLRLKSFMPSATAWRRATGRGFTPSPLATGAGGAQRDLLLILAFSNRCDASSSSPSTRHFRDSVRRFMQKEIAPHAARWREQGLVDRWAFTKAGEQGYLLMWADEKYGGAGVTDFRFPQIVYEENMREGDPGFYLQLHSGLVATLPRPCWAPRSRSSAGFRPACAGRRSSPWR